MTTNFYWADDSNFHPEKRIENGVSWIAADKLFYGQAGHAELQKCYQESLTREQRKRLMHLLIRQITINEDRKIDTIQIQLNKEVAKHFTFKGGEDSSITDEFSPPFSILIDL